MNAWATLGLALLPLATPQGITIPQLPGAPQRRTVPPRPGLLPPRPGTPGAIKPPDNPKNADPFLHPSGDRSHWDAETEILTVEGHARFAYQGYVGTADRATFRQKDRVFVFEGNVRLDSSNQSVFARRVAFNVDTYDFLAEDASTVVPAEVLGGSVLQAVQLAGKRIRRDGEILTVENGFLTTCDLDRPHYQIGFGRATLIPKKRLILRDSTFYRYERPVVRIAHVAIPISEERRYSYLPTVGRTNEEGYFVKAVVGYALSRALPGLLRVDLMEKKGIGLGFDQVYQSSHFASDNPRVFAGRLNVYTLRDKSRGVDNFNARIEHEQRFGEIEARLTTDIANNSYQAALANARSRNTSLTLRRGGVNGTGLALSLNGNNSNFAQSEAKSWTLSQGFSLPRSGRASLRLVRTENDTTSRNGTTTVTVSSLRETGDLTASAPLGMFNAELQANRNFTNRQTGGTGQSTFFAGTERLPELRLSLREPPPSLRRFISGLNLGYGRFLESALIGGVASPLSTDRLLFDLGLANIDEPIGGRGLRLRSAGRFQQTIYDGGAAAQYLLDHNSSLSQAIGDRGEWSLTYHYLRPYGGTPVGFRLDQSGSSNSLTAAYGVQDAHFQLSLGTAYDIERARTPLFPGLPRQPWSNLVANIGFQPSDRFLARLQSTYDPNTAHFLSFSQTMQLRGSEGFAFDTGANYDPRQHKFAQITGRLLTWLFGRGTRFGAQTSYSGFTKRFDYKTLALTQSFHDYEVTFAYIDQPYGFRSEKGFSIGFRLKALAPPQSNGSGRFGTATDAGLGGGFGGYGSYGSGLGNSGFGSGFGNTGLGGLTNF